MFKLLIGESELFVDGILYLILVVYILNVVVEEMVIEKLWGI